MQSKESREKHGHKQKSQRPGSCDSMGTQPGNEPAGRRPSRKQEIERIGRVPQKHTNDNHQPPNPHQHPNLVGIQGWKHPDTPNMHHHDHRRSLVRTASTQRETQHYNQPPLGHPTPSHHHHSTTPEAINIQSPQTTQLSNPHHNEPQETNLHRCLYCELKRHCPPGKGLAPCQKCVLCKYCGEPYTPFTTKCTRCSKPPMPWIPGFPQFYQRYPSSPKSMCEKQDPVYGHTTIGYADLRFP